MAGNQLMAVEVKTAPRFEHGVPKLLFDSRIYLPGASNVFRYAPNANGQRFLFNTAMTSETESQPLTVVLNWTAGLKK